MQIVFGEYFIVTGACQNTQANISLLSICNRRSVWLMSWSLGEHLLIIRSLKYNMDLPFLLAPHLPRMVAWERRKTAQDRQTDRRTDRHYENLYIDDANTLCNSSDDKFKI